MSLTNAGTLDSRSLFVSLLTGAHSHGLSRLHLETGSGLGFADHPVLPDDYFPSKGAWSIC